MTSRKEFNSHYLSSKGLNLHAIFDICDMPGEILPVKEDGFTQLIVLAHGGRTMWQELKQSEIASQNPVDEFSVQTVTAFFETELAGHRYKIIYPSNSPIGLVRLGTLAGWHHESPFRVGINEQWGSWFAYRVVVLTNTKFKTTKKLESESPCAICTDNVCVKACPSGAIGGQYSLEKCIGYRKQNDSLCKQTCLSRWICPVAKEHRYTTEQMRYHYSVSMETINKFY